MRTRRSRPKLEIVNQNIPEGAPHCENYSRPAKRHDEALSRLIEPRIIVPLLRHACSPMLGVNITQPCLRFGLDLLLLFRGAHRTRHEGFPICRSANPKTSVARA